MKRLSCLMILMLILNMMFGVVMADTDAYQPEISYMSGMSVYIYGQSNPLPNPAIYEGVVLMVPLRNVCESLGYEVSWNNDSHEVTITKGTFYTTLKIGENAYYYNKVAPFPLASAPILYGDVTYVPSGFVTKVLMHSLYVQDMDSVIINGPTTSYMFDFEEDEGITFGMHNVLLDEETLGYNILMAYEYIPINQSKGIYLSGTNKDHNMLLYMTKPIEGLDANTMYYYDMYLDLATNEPMTLNQNLIKDSAVKAGITMTMPQQAVENDYYMLSGIDAGMPLQSGEDLMIIADLHKRSHVQDSSFEYKTVHQYSSFITNDEGVAYLTIALETTASDKKEIYIDNIDLECYKTMPVYNNIGTIQKFTGQTITLLSGDILQDYTVVNENLDLFYLYQMAGITGNDEDGYTLVDYHRTNYTEYTSDGQMIKRVEGQIIDEAMHTVVIENANGTMSFYYDSMKLYPLDTNVIVDYYGDYYLYEMYNKDTMVALEVDLISRGLEGQMTIHGSDINDNDYIIFVGSGTSVDFDLNALEISDNIEVYADIFTASIPPQGTAKMIHKVD